MKQLEQICFYNNGNPNNQPVDLTFNRLVSGNVFKDKTPITYLRVSASPGVVFYLNDNITPITIDNSGVFELNIDNMINIYSLHFDPRSMNTINSSNNQYLLIDFIYEHF